MSAGERFATIVVGLCAVLTLTGAGVRVLVKISWRMGQLVERFDAHARADIESRSEHARVHADQEARFRDLERHRT